MKFTTTLSSLIVPVDREARHPDFSLAIVSQICGATEVGCPNVATSRSALGHRLETGPNDTAKGRISYQVLDGIERYRALDVDRCWSLGRAVVLRV